MSGKSQAAKGAVRKMPGLAKIIEDLLREADLAKGAARHGDTAAKRAARQGGKEAKYAQRGGKAAKQTGTPPRNATHPSSRTTRKPRGTPSEATKKAPDTQRYSFGTENTSARVLGKHGYDVHQNPADTPGFRQSREFQKLSPEDQRSFLNNKKPDFIIEGKVFDQFSPMTASPLSVASGISDKVAAGQTTRVVLNLDASRVTGQQMRDCLTKNPIDGLQELILIGGGKLEWLFP